MRAWLAGTDQAQADRRASKIDIMIRALRFPPPHSGPEKPRLGDVCQYRHEETSGAGQLHSRDNHRLAANTNARCHGKGNDGNGDNQKHRAKLKPTRREKAASARAILGATE